jgi:hypothetical protein
VLIRAKDGRAYLIPERQLAQFQLSEEAANRLHDVMGDAAEVEGHTFWDVSGVLSSGVSGTALTLTNVGITGIDLSAYFDPSTVFFGSAVGGTALTSTSP